jgi:hypothetical protein
VKNLQWMTRFVKSHMLPNKTKFTSGRKRWHWTENEATGKICFEPLLPGSTFAFSRGSYWQKIRDTNNYICFFKF